MQHSTSLDIVGIVAGVASASPAALGVTLTKRWGRPAEASPTANEEEQSLGFVDVTPFLLEDRLKERGALHTKAAHYIPHTGE